jgi:hypothetical protein
VFVFDGKMNFCFHLRGLAEPGPILIQGDVDNSAGRSAPVLENLLTKTVCQINPQCGSPQNHLFKLGVASEVITDTVESLDVFLSLNCLRESISMSLSASPAPGRKSGRGGPITKSFLLRSSRPPQHNETHEGEADENSDYDVPWREKSLLHLYRSKQCNLFDRLPIILDNGFGQELVLLEWSHHKRR